MQPSGILTLLIENWRHLLEGANHPGVDRTHDRLHAKYWWPNMEASVWSVVTSCAVCTSSKVPCTLPAGKLLPLPIPARPWLHLAVDFIMDLPVSQGHTVVLVVVNRSLKGADLYPLQPYLQPSRLQKLCSSMFSSTTVS